MNINLSIIIPCYNEADNIPDIFEKIVHLVNDNNFIELIIVNNGSTDHTDEQLQLQLSKIDNKSGRIKLCNVPVNKGYGYGIKAGIKLATANVICWTHADQQTDINDTLRAFQLYKTVNSELAIVKGNRINRNKLDAFFTWGMQLYTNYKLKTALHDINAQPKLFSKTLWKSIEQEAPDDFSLDVYLLYQAKKSGSIHKIDVQYLKRLYGEAKGGGSLKGKWKLIKRTFAYINKLS